jgi:hypothetical protein
MMLEALHAVAESYRAIGLRLLHYEAVPHIYHKVPSTDDLYALSCLEAVRYRCDLSAAVDLTLRPKLRKDRRSDLNKARRSGVQVESWPSYLEPSWAVLEKNLGTKHGARPVHTLEEIIRLRGMFPEQIKCLVGTVEGEIVVGIVLFHTSQVVHIQYTATMGNYSAAALTAVMDYGINKSKDWRARYFDFGTSNERGGKVLNEGLYEFKASFGASGVVHEFYELSLNHE